MLPIPAVLLPYKIEWAVQFMKMPVQMIAYPVP